MLLKVRFDPELKHVVYEPVELAQVCFCSLALFFFHEDHPSSGVPQIRLGQRVGGVSRLPRRVHHCRLRNNR